jgi:hypothetical protein
MRKSIVLLVVIAVVVGSFTLGTVAAESKGKKVMYTASAASMGQPTQFGQPGGMGLVMFNDGSINGKIAVSSLNGNLIFHYNPVMWMELVPGALILLRLELRWIKGYAPYPSTVEMPIPVTGGPAFIDNDGDGKADFMLRVTPVS